jgi:hypothetical protein
MSEEQLMAIFYLLPPRPALEDSLGEFLDSWLPGLPRPADLGGDFIDLLTARLARAEVYVVFREELPEGSDAAESLRDGFGAGPGDGIIELRLRGAREPEPRYWRLDAVPVA